MRFISGNTYQSVGDFVNDVKWAYNNSEYLAGGTVSYFSETASNIKQGTTNFVNDVKWAYNNRDIVAETINEGVQQFKSDVKWAIDNRSIVAETANEMTVKAINDFNSKSLREKTAIITDVTLNVASFLGVPEATAAKLTNLKKVDKLVDAINLVDKLYDAGAGMKRLDNVLDATKMIDDLYDLGNGIRRLDDVADKITVLRKSDNLVEASTGIRLMDNIDNFGRVGIPELPKNAIQRNYLEVVQNSARSSGNALKEFDITRYGDFNKLINRGDGLTGHELLQNAWLEANGKIPKRGVGLSLDNPVIALREDPLHKFISNQQKALGMNKSNLANVSWRRNVLDNISIMKQAGVPRDKIAELAKATRKFAIANGF